MSSGSRRFWPYDEVTLTKDPTSTSRVRINSPWLQFSVLIDPAHLELTHQLIDKMNSDQLSADDLDHMSWFFSSLSKMPLAYILPRGQGFGKDQHRVLSEVIDSSTPQKMFSAFANKNPQKQALLQFLNSALKSNWTWDHQAALEFSQTNEGYDPESLFSIARRFHLLNDIENNRTGDLLEYVRSLKNDSEKFRKASALILRQNHYITEKCDVTLRAALSLAQSASEEVLEFIKAEAGHDRIIEKALQSLQTSSKETPVIETAIALMETFKFAAERNLLGFAMIVDIFERTSYGGDDPMASLLKDGGENQASKQIDIHREINDAGEHENVALEFLHSMAPVDEAYAREALFLAELGTLVIHQLSAQTLVALKDPNKHC